MAETDILNKSVRWDPELQDSIGPDYGWERLRRSQLAIAKPAGGIPWTRTIGNGGHSTQFSWLNRSQTCVERLKRFAEQYEDGFFTIIDHDGGGRHYVGRFVGDMPLSQAGNDRYNIQGWTFEEIPGCPMVKYPGDFDRWAVVQRAVDDFGDWRAATFSAVDGAWVQPNAPPNDDGVVLPAKQLSITAPTAGDWLQYEYRGYGLRVWAGQGPAYGIATLFIDGVNVATLDQYNAADLGAQISYENASMSLGIHRVKLLLTATNNVASAGTGFLFDSLEVMR